MEPIRTAARAATAPQEARGPSIWWWAFGYFAAYAPYAALTRLVTSGLIDTGGTRVSGVELLPSSVIATVVTATAFLAATGWWRRAVRPGERLPRPTWFTALSGLCSAGIIATTTLAYTFRGISIVFVMLLMRGGLLALAPAVDLITGRRIRWFSIAALALSMASLSISTIGGDTAITAVCAVDVALYLAFYFVRLQLMSRKAKSNDAADNYRYFVEEQLVSSPALLAMLAAWAFAGSGAFHVGLHAGFTTFWARPVWWLGPVVGALSQGTGIFGGLILLDRRENTFSIPVNRASSVVAGVVGSLALWVAAGDRAIAGIELLGAAIMIAAIVVLSLGAAYDKRRPVAPEAPARANTLPTPPSGVTRS